MNAVLREGLDTIIFGIIAWTVLWLIAWSVPDETGKCFTPVSKKRREKMRLGAVVEESPGPTFTAWGLTCTVEAGGWSRNCTVYTVDVSLDEAADLADLLLGGPRVCIAPHMLHGRQPWSYPPEIVAWTVWIRAFIDMEALITLHEIEDMMRAGGELPETAVVGRWRGGELEDIKPWSQSADPGPIEIARP